MKLFLYYALHSVKNQLKKLFKTWVAVFFAVCVLFGVVIGFGAAMLSDSADEDFSSDYSEDYYLYEEDMPTVTEVMSVVNPCVLAVTVLLLAINLLSGDKSGGSIFTMADVNLLFSSPLKPQSVLLFKLMTQIGTSLAASLYLIFQLPNLITNVGVPPVAAPGILMGWFFLLIYSKLFSVLSYTLASTHPKYKRFLRPAVYGVIAVIALMFWFYKQSTGLEIFAALDKFFGGKHIFFIPVLGWITGLINFSVLWNPLLFVLFIILLGAGLAALVYIIWNLRADFYEDALSQSAEKDEVMRAAQEGTVVVQTRKKERKRKIKNDGIGRGWGANVFLYKALYNRFRFSYFRVLTKTNITYLLCGVGLAAVTKFITESPSFTSVALVLGVVVFYRSLGNPVSGDIGKPAFFLIPESAHKKLFYSLLAGTVDCVLDLVPAMLLSAILLGENIGIALLWVLFIAAIDFYSSSVGTFLSLAIPESVAKIVKSIIQIFFIYFGLLPIAALVAVGLIFDIFLPCMLGAAAFSIGCGAIFFALSPIFINGGKK